MPGGGNAARASKAGKRLVAGPGETRTYDVAGGTLGWAAVFYLPSFYESATPAVITLLAVGGLLYTVGGVVYGFKWPDPSPRWFGFHEVFHTLTIAAFVTHYIGVSIATYSLR